MMDLDITPVYLSEDVETEQCIVCLKFEHESNSRFIFCADCHQSYHIACAKQAPSTTHPTEKYSRNSFKSQENNELFWRWKWRCDRCRKCKCGTIGSKKDKVADCFHCSASACSRCCDFKNAYTNNLDSLYYYCCEKCRARVNTDKKCQHHLTPMECPKCSNSPHKCPGCHQIYDPDDYDCEMFQCDGCHSWTHKECTFLRNENGPFFCVNCIAGDEYQKDFMNSLSQKQIAAMLAKRVQMDDFGYLRIGCWGSVRKSMTLFIFSKRVSLPTSNPNILKRAKIEIKVCFAYMKGAIKRNNIPVTSMYCKMPTKNYTKIERNAPFHDFGVLEIIGDFPNAFGLPTDALKQTLKNTYFEKRGKIENSIASLSGPHSAAEIDNLLNKIKKNLVEISKTRAKTPKRSFECDALRKSSGSDNSRGYFLGESSDDGGNANDAFKLASPPEISLSPKTECVEILKRENFKSPPLSIHLKPAPCSRLEPYRRGKKKNIESGPFFKLLPENKAKRKGSTVVVGKSRIAGLGLFTCIPLRSQQKIIDYCGEIIDQKTADAREIYYNSLSRWKNDCYLFKIATNRIIDATLVANEARFINHSCDPNCGSYSTENGIFIFALREIEAWTELTYDYRFSRETENEELVPCFCESDNCRKWMNADC